MKTLGILLSLLVSISAFGRYDTARGSGSATGFCDGSGMSHFCLDNIQQQARREAVSRAEMDCRIRNGTPQGSYTASCGFEYCNPNFIPVNSPSQYVSCRSECTLGCEIKEHE